MDYEDGDTTALETNHTSYGLKVIARKTFDSSLSDRSFRCPKIEGSLYQNQDYTPSDYNISKNLLELYLESGVTDII